MRAVIEGDTLELSMGSETRYGADALYCTCGRRLSSKQGREKSVWKERLLETVTSHLCWYWIWGKKVEVMGGGTFELNL